MNAKREVPERLQSCGLKDDDTACVFCFKEQEEMHKAFDAAQRNRTRYWAEKRTAVKGVISPYWLVCQAEMRDALQSLLKNDRIQWDDVESHYYGAIKEQSVLLTTSEVSSGVTKVRTIRWRLKRSEKRWWRFWG